ncbi:MAG: alginate lyase family protein, partial [Planctomycetes bacterium]|nr:alginate lyase family protein [Planctomycetota bacterium]
MTKIIPTACLTGAIVLVCSYTAICGEETPRVFLLDGGHLAEARQQMQQSPSQFATCLEAIRQRAEDDLTGGPWSVMDKKHVPPSGDKHDYFSVGPYWWPDPSKPGGLPYIRRDGEVNPERHEYDNVGLKNTVSAVRNLAIAYYFTRDTKYAERASRLLRTWFLDPATLMNPHLEYAQAIPGRTQGRGIGIIDTAQLASLVDAVGLLQASEAWTDSDQSRLQAWFREYLQWLLVSSHGKDEADTENNHAVWYDVQVASFALFVGEKATAGRVLEQVGPRRIATQIEPDGRMPRELARTKSFSYTHMNLRGFLQLDQLAEHVGVDLWNY